MTTDFAVMLVGIGVVHSLSEVGGQKVTCNGWVGGLRAEVNRL